MLARDNALRPPEELVDGQRLTRGGGVGKEKRVEFIDNFGSQDLPKGNIALSACDARLNQCADQARYNSDHSQCCERYSRTIPAHKLRCTIRYRVPPRIDWLVPKITPEIIGQCSNGSVSLCLGFLERF